MSTELVHVPTTRTTCDYCGAPIRYRTFLSYEVGGSILRGDVGQRATPQRYCGPTHKTAAQKRRKRLRELAQGGQPKRFPAQGNQSTQHLPGPRRFVASRCRDPECPRMVIVPPWNGAASQIFSGVRPHCGDGRCEWRRELNIAKNAQKVAVTPETIRLKRLKQAYTALPAIARAPVRRVKETPTPRPTAHPVNPEPYDPQRLARAVERLESEARARASRRVVTRYDAERLNRLDWEALPENERLRRHAVWVTECPRQDKVRYVHSGVAQQAARLMRDTSAYRCRCGFWHVGHAPAFLPRPSAG